jgi:hypothetical protein
MLVRNGGAIANAVVVLALVAGTGCGDDGGGGDGGLEDGGSAGVGGEGGSSGASGAGGSGGGGGCLDPLAQDLVFQPTNLSEGSVIYQVVEDDGTLYFSTIDRLFRVDGSGGEPEEIYYADLAIVVKFWLRADDLLILDGGDTLLSLPKEGGETTELAVLPFRVESGLDGSVEMIVEGDKAYAKSVSGGIGVPEVVTYYEIDLTSYESRELAMATDELNGSFIKAGDALYVASDDPSAIVDEDDLAAFVPDLIHRIPIAGGGPELVDVEGEPMRMGMLGADGDALYVLARFEDDFTASGVYRVPASGGPREQVHEQIVLFAQTFWIYNTPSRTLLRDLDTFYELPISGTAQELFCVGGGDYTSHGSAATDDAVYMSLFHSDDEESFIVRMPLE